MTQIRAITFDLFGTLLEVPADCQWMRLYAAEVRAIEKGETPYRPIGDILREVGMDWRDLKPRSGVIEALADLRNQYQLALLSNAGDAIGWEVSARCGMRWDAIVPTERITAYKPNPRVYSLALRSLNCEEGEVLHVAAHAFDLRGAKAMGFKTAYLRWPGYLDEPVAEGEFDYVEASLGELVARLLEEAVS